MHSIWKTFQRTIIWISAAVLVLGGAWVIYAGMANTGYGISIPMAIFGGILILWGLLLLGFEYLWHRMRFLRGVVITFAAAFFAAFGSFFLAWYKTGEQSMELLIPGLLLCVLCVLLLFAWRQKAGDEK